MSKPAINSELIRISSHDYELAMELRQTNQTGIGVVHLLTMPTE